MPSDYQRCAFFVSNEQKIEMTNFLNIDLTKPLEDLWFVKLI